MTDILTISVPLFIFAGITYFLHKEVFNLWALFTVIWIPLSVFSASSAPTYGNVFLPIEKASVSFFASVLFIIISQGNIIFKSIQLKKAEDVTIQLHEFSNKSGAVGLI